MQASLSCMVLLLLIDKLSALITQDSQKLAPRKACACLHAAISSMSWNTYSCCRKFRLALQRDKVRHCYVEVFMLDSRTSNREVLLPVVTHFIPLSGVSGSRAKTYCDRGGVLQRVLALQENYWTIKEVWQASVSLMLFPACWWTYLLRPGVCQQPLYACQFLRLVRKQGLALSHTLGRPWVKQVGCLYLSLSVLRERESRREREKERKRNSERDRDRERQKRKHKKLNKEATAKTTKQRPYGQSLRQRDKK